MAKPTTGRVDHLPEPDPDQMAADTLMTSVFSGLGLIAATFVLAILGTAGYAAAGGAGAPGNVAKFGLGAGLALGMALIAWGLRRYSARIRARSTNLYRGAWIGSVAALVIIVFMAYFPQVVIPQYCPPGQICVNGRR
jgi:uncharacterized membrane protein YidH (DUF202 family)